MLDRTRYRQSLIILPSLYVLGAILLGNLAPQIDKARDGGSANIDTARDVLIATATGMIAFTGFVLSGVLLVVQFAAGSYSPRLVLWFRRDHLIKHAIGIFLAAFVFALVALRRLDEPGSDISPDVTVGVALAPADRLVRAVPRAAAARHGPAAAARAVRRGHARGDPGHAADLSRRARRGARRGAGRVGARRSGAGAQSRAIRASSPRSTATRCSPPRRRAGATIELVLAVGEYARPHAELLRVHGGPAADPGALARHVRIAGERTIEQDPAFAMRIVVDTAIRALSPAVNDPTTAVHGARRPRGARGRARRPRPRRLARARRRRRACGWSGARRAGTTCSTWRSTRSAATARARCRSRGGCARCSRTCSRRTPPQRHAALRRAARAARRRGPHGVPGGLAGAGAGAGGGSDGPRSRTRLSASDG